MDNKEILKRFDVLYNNIMSDRAPGLNAYEKSVFWNKATLEVLKNHLNPKGNRYTEGFDDSSKRQIDFSDLTVKESYLLYPKRVYGISPSTWVLAEVRMMPSDENPNTNVFKPVDIKLDFSHMLSILNETLGVAQNDQDYYVNLAKTLMVGDIRGFDMNEDGVINISDYTGWINAKIAGEIPEYVNVDKLVAYLIGNSKESSFVFEEPKTSEEIIEEQSIKTERLVVVPINYTEYDTLMSRPYKHPSKSQAWRMFVNGETEFVIGPNSAPYRYDIRYVKMPAQVDLASNINSDVPEILHDEILQRAVELAKNSWDGNVESTMQIGARSE